jgi:hypothetical protein
MQVVRPLPWKLGIEASASRAGGSAACRGLPRPRRVCGTHTLFEQLLGGLEWERTLFEPCLKRLPELGVVFQQTVNEVVTLFQRDELKLRHTVDRYNHRFRVAETTVSAQARLGLTQRNHFHGE